MGGIRYYNVPELPYSVSQTDPEVGNTHHFENGIEGGLKFFANDPLVAQPGTHFNYSTQGYTLVGCVIEGASGESYAEYVRENVLVPAGMLQMRLDDRFAITPLRARFYSRGQIRCRGECGISGFQLHSPVADHPRRRQTGSTRGPH